MSTSVKLTVAALAAMLALSFAVSGASANRLSASNRAFRITWRSLEGIADTSGTVRCPATMEGSFHSSTISKIAAALIGSVSRATIESAACTGGTATFEQAALPWHVVYGAFGGALPRVSWWKKLFRNMEIHIIFGGVSCDATTTVANPFAMLFDVSEETVTETTAESGASIPLRGSFLCEIAGSLRMGGKGTMLLLGTNTRIRLKLI